MRRIKKTVTTLSRYIVMTACGVISVFVLSSGYESVYSRSLPYVHTVDPVNLTSIARVAELDMQTGLAVAADDTKQYGQFGRPTVLKMPGANANLRLDIAEPIVDGQTWLARSTALHAVLPRPAKNGNVSLLVLYCRASFRTINTVNLPAGGANVFVDTDQKWRYVYKVSSARSYPQDQPYILTASQTSSSVSGKLLVACNDEAKGVTDIVEADLLSVQGAEL